MLCVKCKLIVVEQCFHCTEFCLILHRHITCALDFAVLLCNFYEVLISLSLLVHVVDSCSKPHLLIEMIFVKKRIPPFSS